MYHLFTFLLDAFYEFDINNVCENFWSHFPGLEFVFSINCWVSVVASYDFVLFHCSTFFFKNFIFTNIKSLCCKQSRKKRLSGEARRAYIIKNISAMLRLFYDFDFNQLITLSWACLMTSSGCFLEHSYSWPLPKNLMWLI